MSIDYLSDKELATQAKELAEKGEQDSNLFSRYANELYNRFFSQGYNIARYYGLSRDDAQDAVQIAFIKVFRSIKRYNPHFEFKPWFFKIVHNCVKDKYRDNTKHRYSDIDNVSEIAQNIFDEFHIRETLGSIISELPEKLKVVVIFRIYAEMSFEMISDTIGISVRQCHNRLNKAYEIVRMKLEEENL